MPVKTYDSKLKNMKADRIFIPEILLAPLFCISARTTDRRFSPHINEQGGFHPVLYGLKQLAAISSMAPAILLVLY